VRRPWLIVSGDFTPWGGMDRANFALAARLACTGHEVHLVTHRADQALARCGAVVHCVRRPAGSHALGMPWLARAATRRATELQGRQVQVVANGGNCTWPGIDWVHYVHAAYDPRDGASLGPRLLAGAQRRYVLDRERRAIRQARAVICNSARTRRDVVERLGVAPERAHLVYYGTDAAQFAAVTEGERARARAELNATDGRLTALFVGALGDRRKGFDALFEAWIRLCRRSEWDVDLIVAGEGRELGRWRARAEARGLARRIRLLGYRRDVPRLLAAADVLVHPARYEAYGLAVHEAICRGVPAIVSAQAGVAERYPAGLASLLLAQVDSGEIESALLRWRAAHLELQAAAAATGDSWRLRTWDVMSDEIAAVGRAL
jgi:glycosyltransferase involved in cell wall biosynthesis